MPQDRPGRPHDDFDFDIVLLGLLECCFWILLASHHRAFLFLSGQLAPTSYHTNKTRLAKAPFGRADDDNGPGSEPPPHDRKRYVSTFITSRRRPPTAPESRAFLASRSTISLDDACGSSRDRWTFPIDFSMAQGRTGDPKTMVRTSGIIGIGCAGIAVFLQHRLDVQRYLGYNR